MLVLVIFFIIVVLAIATSAPKGKESLPAPTVAPTTEPISLCIPFLKNPAKLSCQKAAEVASVKTGIGIPEIKAAFGLLKHCGSIALAKEALTAAVEIRKVM